MDQRQNNQAAQEYLEEYCTPQVTRDFAVLLDGPWGAGKTHFIKEFLRNHPNHLYISLYGVSSVRQIDEEIFRQLHPVLASKGMRVLGRVGKAALRGAFKFDFDGDGKDDGTLSLTVPDLDLKKEFSDPKGHLLVFDDLERASMPIRQVLGYINVFVEHAEMKAIIIANEDELLKREEDERYLEIKEKLVGQTLRISASVEEAYSEFLKGIDNPRVRAFLESQRNAAIGVHLESGTDNLRLLKQALWDYERLAAHFDDQHWENHDAMRSVLRILLALSIEHRAGNLKEFTQIQSLLQDRILRQMTRKKDAPKATEDQIEEKYQTVDFGDKVLTAHIFGDAVINGHVNKVSVQEALAASRYFQTPTSTPIWKRAWDFFDLDDEQAATVASEFKSAFDRREFTKEGEVFHAFGILLRYSSLGLIKMSRTEAYKYCKQYVDDLVSDGHLAFYPQRKSLFEFRGSYENHVFIDHDKKDFQRLVDYYNARYEEVAKEAYPQLARQLLESLEKGEDDFLLDLAQNNVRPSLYSERPILTALSPNEFVDRILKLDGQKQRTAFQTLKERYRFVAPDRPLSKEMPWLRKVRTQFRKEIKSAGPVTAERLGYLVKSCMDDVLSRWDKQKAATKIGG
ncbi:KAP family NTPase [Qipengyuania aquimaris]|uniref:P-loop NTPase fold protein n=1 Tax=Qipengyuania aquimaris TaxID=255984 RepID=UPI001C954387|nr:P-loop NTPase fold protein [Qipengyuania aquimaris]MBY6128771.1 KAP family NTPase [Qipengyuania aquimaris]